MTTSPRRIGAALLTASVLALPLAAAAPTSAHAGTACEINGFTPTTVEVGLSRKVVTFKPKVSDCTLDAWYIEGDNFVAYDGGEQWSFYPVDNAETALQDVEVGTLNSDGEQEIRVFRDAFRLKRNTTWDKFNASPEPVSRGAKITIKGRLRIADWTNHEYDGYTNRSIDVEFKPRNGSYQRVKTVTSGSGGYVSTTVAASADGTWRLRYGGNSIAGGGATPGDFVDIR